MLCLSVNEFYLHRPDKANTTRGVVRQEAGVNDLTLTAPQGDQSDCKSPQLPVRIMIPSISIVIAKVWLNEQVTTESEAHLSEPGLPPDLIILCLLNISVMGIFI